MEWGPEQSEAFRQLKNYIATSLVVTVPEPDTLLLLYVVASKHVISMVLVHEKKEPKGIIQRLVYYMSEALLEAKLNYTEIEKIADIVLTT